MRAQGTGIGVPARLPPWWLLLAFAAALPSTLQEAASLGSHASPAVAARPAGARSPAVATSRHQPAPGVARKLKAVVERRPARSLAEDLRSVLPRYRRDFEEAASRSGLDWRLLAAVGYQESRWNPAAQSPTGVRGLMMLTQDTALGLGVDREDATQSILGAGRLLRAIYGQLPPRIREPDRTAMALAAYNQGLGHLLDARDVADLRGGDPDRWDDVRQALPLLEREEWIPTTKYGYARGSEAVEFVECVGRYYLLLKAAANPAKRPA